MPRSAVRPLKMNMEEAMRFTLTAGITGATTSSKDTVEAIKMSKHEDGDG
jgi:uncharacterized membrane protein